MKRPRSTITKTITEKTNETNAEQGQTINEKNTLRNENCFHSKFDRETIWKMNKIPMRCSRTKKRKLKKVMKYLVDFRHFQEENKNTLTNEKEEE